MLVSLRIANFVLLDDCRVDFHPGLNVLTGETGAGKTIVVDALNLLIGERSSSGTVRDSDEEAIVEAAFELNPNEKQTHKIFDLLRESGLPAESGTLLIKRTISQEGRNRIFVNNSQCLLKKLKEIGELLVDLHGQHEHQSLLHKSAYGELVDGFASNPALPNEYRESYQVWVDLKEQIRNLERDERERKRREDMLRYQIEEIDGGELKEGEIEEVDARLQVIRHAERLGECCGKVLSTLFQGESERSSIMNELETLDTQVREIARLDASQAAILESWQSALISLQEISRDLESYARGLEYDPEELERLQQRRFRLRELTGKYGATVSDIMTYRDRIGQELEGLQNALEESERLRKNEKERRNELVRLGKRLHDQRKKTAKSISRRVTAELGSLGMESACFEIQIAYRYSDTGQEIGESRPVDFGPNGADDVEFLVTTIPGRPPRPLREIASGGEISRIMLALKCTFGETDPVPTMVFDEIDVGVGGKTAEAVALRLAQLSAKKQVLCITHLPHIASRADRSLKVDKYEEAGRLLSRVTILKGKEKELELVRMLGGDESAASKRYARELLKSSK